MSDNPHAKTEPHGTAPNQEPLGDSTYATSEQFEDAVVVNARLPTGDWMTLEVPAGDDIGSRVAATSLPYESVELGIIDAFLPPNPSIIDVGANIGNHSIYWAISRHAVVTAYEPYPLARQFLNANINRNAVAHLVTTRSEAIGSAPGGAAAVPKKGNLGATRMVSNPTGPVRVANLDSLNSVDCDLLKVDVEGNELDVLKGASGLLNEVRPLVWLEVLTAEDYARVRAFMRAHGYRSSLLLSPTNVVFLPSRRFLLRLASNRLALWGYLRRSGGRLVRRVRPLLSG